MKQIKSFSIALLAWITFGGGLLACPAFPGLMQITQPDGTQLLVYLKGDPSFSIRTTEDNYTLIFNKAGILEYAKVDSNGNLAPSGVKAHNIAERSAEENAYLATISKGLFYSDRQVEMPCCEHTKVHRKIHPSFAPNGITKGTRKVLTILVNFQDKAFVTPSNAYDNLFNEHGYNYNGATGSVKDYFKTVSYGQFELQATVVGPYTLPNSMAFYGAHYTYPGGYEANDVNAKQMIIDACELANPDVDFTQFDQDGDGFVESVYVIYAGYSEAQHGPAESIWPHRSRLDPPVYFDGVRVKDYSCSSELKGNYGAVRSGIGTICHEYGHVLGLLDYYDTDYAGSGGTSNTIGPYDIMDQGSYLNDENTPPMYGPLSRIQLGWASPVLLDSTTHADIRAIKTVDSNLCFRINSRVDGEFILLEARGKVGQDVHLPTSGLTAYRVNGNTQRWNDNTLNVTPDQQGYEIVRAHGAPQSGISIFDVSGTVTEINSHRQSQYRSYNGDSIPVNISNIAVNSINLAWDVTFKVNEGSAHLPTITLQDAQNITQTGASVSGNVVAAVSNSAAITECGVVYSLHHYPTVADHKVAQGNATGNFQATLANLAVGKEYFVRGYVQTASGIAYSNEIRFHTPTPAITNNTILPGDYAKCSTGELPLILGSDPQGGNGTFSYRWIASQNGTTWVEAFRANAWKNYLPEDMANPTSYRRVVYSGDISDTTAPITVNIVAATVTGSITVPNSEILAHTPTGDMTLTGQEGTVVYWQRKIGTASWEVIDNTKGLTTLNETPIQVDKYRYRVKVQNGACPPNVSSPVVIDVKANTVCVVEGQRVQLSLYPNPAKDLLSLDLEMGTLHNFEMQIFDINGKTVISKQGLQTNNRIDISALSEGSYLVVLYHNGKPVTQKQIVKIR